MGHWDRFVCALEVWRDDALRLKDFGTERTKRWCVHDCLYVSIIKIKISWNFNFDIIEMMTSIELLCCFNYNWTYYSRFGSFAMCPPYNQFTLKPFAAIFPYPSLTEKVLEDGVFRFSVPCPIFDTVSVPFYSSSVKCKQKFTRPVSLRFVRFCTDEAHSLHTFASLCRNNHDEN